MYYFIFLNVVQWRRGAITASGYRTDINRRYYLLLPLVEKLKLSGAGGIRTPYLRDANATFSRVNYGPAVTLEL